MNCCCMDFGIRLSGHVSINHIEFAIERFSSGTFLPINHEESEFFVYEYVGAWV